MPLASVLPLLLVAVVLVVWGVLGVFARRGDRRRARRADEWSRFAHGHRQLDRELDDVWHRR